jgi:hypothetical protein
MEELLLQLARIAKTIGLASVREEEGAAAEAEG